MLIHLKSCISSKMFKYIIKDFFILHIGTRGVTDRIGHYLRVKFFFNFISYLIMGNKFAPVQLIESFLNGLFIFTTNLVPPIGLFLLDFFNFTERFLFLNG